jgi:phosphate butyryltransferase
MYKNFSDILNRTRQVGPVILSVAVAQDWEVLNSIKSAQEAGLIEAILVGDAQKIKDISNSLGMGNKCLIIDEPSEEKAALTATSLVNQGKAKVLMKGLINTADFLKAVLDPIHGLRTDKLLSHLAAFDIPGQKKVIFHTDGGMNIAPSLQEKKDIVINAIKALETLGIKNPKVAILAANEKVSSSMPSTVDAQALVKLREEGIIPSGILEGPISMDVAVSPESAKHKGIESVISGDVDLFVVPNIEAGNLQGKTWLYYTGAKMAGVILGASQPIVMTSRSESAEGKLVSISLASLLAHSILV